MAVTKIEDIKKYVGPKEVELPGWEVEEIESDSTQLKTLISEVKFAKANKSNSKTLNLSLQKIEEGLKALDKKQYTYKPIPFVAKLQRVSLLNLVKNGKIPNQLMSYAQDLFFQRVNPKTTDIKEISKVLDIIVESCLVEPSYSEVKDYLTDDQKYYIFEYSQKGTQALGKY